MDRECAELAMRLIDEVGESLNKLTELSDQFSDQNEQIEFRKILGVAMMAIGLDLFKHIIDQYPDLDTDKMGTP